MPIAWPAAAAGGTGGTQVDLMCPKHEFLVGLNLRAGSGIDALQIVCRDLR